MGHYNESKAFDEGYDAAFGAASVTSLNPYQEGTRESEDWYAGYDAAIQHIAESDREYLTEPDIMQGEDYLDDL